MARVLQNSTKVLKFRQIWTRWMQVRERVRKKESKRTNGRIGKVQMC